MSCRTAPSERWFSRTPATCLPARQTALLEWLDAGGDRRIIATTRQSLFPRVESGLFSIALYYRLNVITIDFTDAVCQS